MACPTRTFGWGVLLRAPLRAIQITVVTILMVILHWLVCLFDKADLPGSTKRHDHDTHAHEYRPPRTKDVKDSRSPCPALNTLANHGYLPRTGRHIRPYQFIQALQEGYNISYPLAAVLTWGSFILLQQWRKISLKDLARHGCVEHNASLAHGDAIEDKEYAPTLVDESYLRLLLADSQDGVGLTAEDIAKARVRRESAYSQPLDGVHAEIARGEMAMVLDLFGVEEEGGKQEVAVDMLKEWWTYERLPAAWKPRKRIGLIATFFRSRSIKKHMENIKNEQHQPQ